MPARVRASKKVSVSLPTALLEMADFQAARLGLERYDVVRMALAQGLLLLELQAQAAEGKFTELGQEMSAAFEVLKHPDAFGDLVAANAKDDADRLRKSGRLKPKT